MKRFLILLGFCFVFTSQLHGAERIMRGKAILGDDVKNVVPGAMVSYRAYDSPVQTDLRANENGEFEILMKSHPVYVEVMTPDKNFGKVVVVQPTESELLVSMELTATVRGKIVDIRSDKPPAGRSVIYYVLVRDNASSNDYDVSFPREAKTDEMGEYVIRNIPTGVQCNLYLRMASIYGLDQSFGLWSFGHPFELQPGENPQRKDFAFDSRPGMEFFYQVFNAHVGIEKTEGNLIEQRFDILRRRAQREGKGVFAIMVRDKLHGSDFTPLSSVYEMLFKDDDVFVQTERFYMICVLMQREDQDERYIFTATAKEFVESHKIAEKPLPALFSFAFFDGDGKLRGVEPFDHAALPEKRKQDLIEMLKKY